MKTKNSIKLTMLLVVALAWGCNDPEGKLLPSEIETGYHVPQGNSVSDSRIVSYYEKYGTYILYQYTEKDSYWTPSEWKNGAQIVNTTNKGKSGFLVYQPEMNYVGNVLDILEEGVFKALPDEFLKRFLPVKILLCSKVETYASRSGTLGFGYYPTEVDSYYSFHNLCVSRCSSDVLTISDGQKLNYIRSVIRSIMTSISAHKPIEPPANFVALTNYTTPQYTNTGMWANGMLFPSGTVINDWDMYLLLVASYPYEYLTRTPTGVLDNYKTDESQWEGLLHPTKDTKGVIKKRYDIVRKYFIDNHGIDFQTIGNKFTIN